MTLERGDLLNNRYRILKPLGEGGFGAVYIAEDLILKTRCAIKENLDYWEEAQEQFEREALILAGLRHPNLPRVTDYFRVPGQGQYLVMDIVEGYDLQTILDRVGKPLAEKQVLTWMEQICDALVYLHSQKPPIIHRDIKPANIKITAAGQAVLIDFGIAKQYQPGTKTTLAARAVTAGYSPVEQYGQESTDARADIYALGATMYTLLTNIRPPESVARVSGTPLTAPRLLNPQISSATEKIVLKALEIRANERYGSAAEMQAALRQVLQRPGTGAPSLETPPARPSAPPISRPVAGSGDNAINAPPPSPREAATAAPISHKSAVRLEWVKIPAGEFLFGEERRRISLPAFEIARYPVTNAQYKLFLQANPGYPPPAHWRGGTYPMGKARHPVIGVSLYDALAFCEWLGVRLPTEEEWEKAARGDKGLLLPWGEDWQDGKYCNNWEANIKGTTPVDRYPLGASPYGVMDLLGNVWEWTATEYQGPHMHVLKGGSWRSYSRFAMATTRRDWLTLGDSRDDVGFRCARDLPG